MKCKSIKRTGSTKGQACTKEATIFDYCMTHFVHGGREVIVNE